MGKNVCIIPARGGSKRIPRKNIKDFLGKPIMAYSIEAALKSGLFEEVMVSTDDDEIAEVAKNYGAKVPFMRSQKNADDFATTFEVLHEVLQNYRMEKDSTFDYCCCLYPTAPFASSVRLKEAHDRLKKEKFDSVLPIMPFGFPVQRAFIKQDHRIRYTQPEHEKTRSQDLKPHYHDAGQFYWLNIGKCLEASSLVTENSGAVELKELEGQDIDTETDWKLAELKYELLQNLK